MQRFSPFLLDRLIDAEAMATVDAVKPTLTLAQLKDSVARDVEALLNTRCAIDAQAVRAYPHAKSSVLTFGLDDFAARSMASTEDQAFVCKTLEQAIADHEPRLRQVQVQLSRRDATTQRLKFSIRAMLVAHPMQAPVNFDAVLQTTTQRYAVAAPGRGPHEDTR